MTASDGNLVPGPAEAEAPTTTETATEWAVRLTRRPDGADEWFLNCADGPDARRQAGRGIAFHPPEEWNAEVVSRIAMASPWQPTTGLGPDAAQLAALVETAAETLRNSVYSVPLSSVYTVPLSGEAAPAVAGHLRAALDHIAALLSPAVSYALPHSARPLDVAATRIGLTADMIGSAGPAIAAAASSTVDFPDEVKAAAPDQGGATGEELHGAARSATPWLDEILRTAGDISPATAAKIQHAAEYGYHAWNHDGEAWAQWAGRHQAKSALAGLATESDPSVQAALRAYREARRHAEYLSEAATGHDGESKDILTPEGLAFCLADHVAGAAYEAYADVYRAAAQRYDARVSQAWRRPDIGFLRSHHAELVAADPESFRNILTIFGEEPGAPPVSGEPGSVPTGSADAAQVTADTPGKAAGGRAQPHLSQDFPGELPKRVPFRPATPRRTTGQPSETAPRRTP